MQNVYKKTVENADKVLNAKLDYNKLSNGDASVLTAIECRALLYVLGIRIT